MSEICDNNFTSSYNNENHYNNNQNFNSFGTTMMYNQVLTMTIILLITTFFTALCKLLVDNIRNLTKLFLNYYNQKISNKK